MKKIIFALIMLFCMAGVAFATSSGDAWNHQQEDQSFALTDHGVNGAYSKYGETQHDIGASQANGGTSVEANYQEQDIHTNDVNSAATARHQYDIHSVTKGNSRVNGVGAAGHTEATQFGAQTLTVTDGTGTAMISGAGLEGEASAVAGTVGGKAHGETLNNAKTEYEAVNNGTNSYQYSKGTSVAKMHTKVKATGLGASAAGAKITTAGGTGMVNNNAGTSMSTTALSSTDVDTNSGVIGSGHAASHAMAGNEHYGEQAAASGGLSQYQQTYVSTTASE